MTTPPKRPISDCYEILGIATDATLKDINSAYKRLALKHHPDKARGNEASSDEFRKIQEAVEILRDPFRRMKHNEELSRTRRVFVEEQVFDSSYTGWRPHNPRRFDLSNPREGEMRDGA
ncbi:hypothetical protein EYZ11_009811 [Aspergillus tanneri]|uniref:J domain-containing protein n=1 Tax=Aspergillus tanneri TaxID=1220188 RepID=A0A4S3J6Y4_9EURO|nr:hypothetical protein EYZ11_009811 [Aspergillus tanneri]